MATQQIDFSTIQTIRKNGVDITKIILDGTRRWERYVVQEVYQVWVESGENQTVAVNETLTNYAKYSRGQMGSTLGNASFMVYFNHSYVGQYVYYKGQYMGRTSHWTDITHTVGTLNFRKNGAWYHTNNGAGFYAGIKVTGTTTQWVDTSHYEDRTRDKTVYFY